MTSPHTLVPGDVHLGGVFLIKPLPHLPIRDHVPESFEHQVLADHCPSLMNWAMNTSARPAAALKGKPEGGRCFPLPVARVHLYITFTHGIPPEGVRSLFSPLLWSTGPFRKGHGLRVQPCRSTRRSAAAAASDMLHILGAVRKSSSGRTAPDYPTSAQDMDVIEE